MFKIVNDRNTDFHIHSSNYSDGIDSITEIIDFAEKIGLKRIAITDHSQYTIDIQREKVGIYSSSPRYALDLWENVQNDVDVIFGIEADLLNENGDICDHIQNIKSDFLILSAHKHTYSGDISKLNEAIENAVLKNKDKIKCIGHPCMTHSEKKSKHPIDFERLAKFANKNKLPLEINGTNMARGVDDIESLREMLEYAKYIMINSDAHNLYHLKTSKEFAYNWLEKEGYL
jgi:histidinol phosphatase-like PHP family hydrolase